MAYQVGKQYYLVWLTGDTTVDGIIAGILDPYGFTLDSDHGCWYLEISDSFDEDDILYAFEEAELFDINSKPWDYLHSYEVPKQL